MPDYRLEYMNPNGPGWEYGDRVPGSGGDAADTVANFLANAGGMVGSYRYRDADDDEAPWAFLTLTEDGSVVRH